MLVHMHVHLLRHLMARSRLTLIRVVRELSPLVVSDDVASVRCRLVRRLQRVILSDWSAGLSGKTLQWE